MLIYRNGLNFDFLASDNTSHIFIYYTTNQNDCTSADILRFNIFKTIQNIKKCGNINYLNLI